MRSALTTLLPVVALAAMPAAASADMFVDTTPGLTAFAVPAGVKSLTVSATAGAGGDLTNSSGTKLLLGGRGGVVTGTVAVFPGEQLQLTVATNGGNGNVSTGVNGGAGAPDGGISGYSAGGGGGATRVLDCPGVVCPLAVIAAGGGGAGADGFVSNGTTFPRVPGGGGGGAEGRGTDGTTDVSIVGGSGGQPGTASAVGLGGSGFDAGDNGSGPTGGAGGNHTGSFNQHEGGGGGGGGVFGGGGGGSGNSGSDGSFQAYAGGGGGGGGSSLVPSGGNLNLSAAGAVPRIVLTWTLPTGPGSGSGPGSGGGGSAIVAAVSRETLSPSAFPAAPSGPTALAAKRRYGTKVAYTLNQAASVSFTVFQPQSGRRAKGGRCVKPTRANRKARKCSRLVALPGTFRRAGSVGANSFRFTGRLAGHKLKPGSYRLVATPRVGANTGRAASASFRIIN